MLLQLMNKVGGGLWDQHGQALFQARQGNMTQITAYSFNKAMSIVSSYWILHGSTA
jgi:hypothetical protein